MSRYYNENIQKIPKVVLLLKRCWLRKILNGTKSWEIRGNNTAKKGSKIYLTHEKYIYGEAFIFDTFETTKEILKQHTEKHQIQNLDIISYRKIWVWKFVNSIAYEIQFRHIQNTVK